MNALSEQENKIIKLLTTMESIEFDTTEINISYEGKEYTVTLSRNMVHRVNGSEESNNSKTEIKISSKNEGELILKRYYESNYTKRGDLAGDWRRSSVFYTGKEILPDNELIHIEGYGYNDDTDQAINSIKKYREEKIDGKTLKTYKDNSDISKVEYGLSCFKKAINIISFQKKINGSYSLSSCYLFDIENETYYLKKGNENIPLEALEKKLTTIEEKLAEIEKDIDEVNETLTTVDIPSIASIDEKYFDSIADKKREFAELKENIQLIIANNYYQKNIQWTNFSEDTLAKIYNAVTERLAEIETQNMEHRVEEKVNSLSEAELQYIKKYLNSNKTQNK